jgi:CBS domain-containing protein
MKIRSVMSTAVVTVAPDTTLKDAAAKLVRFGISGMPVVDDDKHVLGVLSEADVLAKEAGTAPRDGMLAWLLDGNGVTRTRLEARTVGEAMTTPALTIGPERTVREAAARMLSDGVNRLPVVENGALVGIVSRADLVRAFARSDDEIRREIEAEVVRQTLWLDPGGFTVDVQDGVVTLSGELDSEADIELLREFVRRVPGVVNVRSRLHTHEDARAAKG